MENKNGKSANEPNPDKNGQQAQVVECETCTAKAAWIVITSQQQQRPLLKLCNGCLTALLDRREHEKATGPIVIQTLYQK